MADLIVNVDTDNVEKQKHIAWYAKTENGKYVLYEVIERFYVHPGSEGCASISRIEVDRVKSIIGTTKAAHLINLENAENIVSLIETPTNTKVQT